MTAGATCLVSWNDARPEAPALVCIPWAGAGAAPYRAWVPVLGDRMQIHAARLAGREGRFGEQPRADIADVVAELGAALKALNGRPIHLLGHCSGAIIAFELARLARRAGLWVTSLIVVGQVTPALFSDSPFDDDARRFVPLELHREPDLAKMLIALIDADTRMIKTYAYRPDAPLDIPISVLRGADDDSTTDGDLEKWSAETVGVFRRGAVAGADHLFAGDASWLNLARAVGQAVATAHESGVEEAR